MFVDVHTMARQSKWVPQSLREMVAINVLVRTVVKWSVPQDLFHVDAPTMAIPWPLERLSKMVATLVCVNLLEQSAAPTTRVIVNTWVEPCSLVKLF